MYHKVEKEAAHPGEQLRMRSPLITYVSYHRYGRFDLEKQTFDLQPQLISL